MAKIKEAHDMLALTIIADPPYIESVKQKIHSLGSHFKKMGTNSVSGSSKLESGDATVSPKDLKFYTTIPEIIQLLQKQLKKEVMGKSLASKQNLLQYEMILSKTYFNIERWLYMVLDCVKINSKLSEKARKVVSDIIREILFTCKNSLESVHKMILLLDRNEEEEYFEKRVEEDRIRIEETRKKIKEKNEELITLNKTLKSLAEAF